jgi:hypothetical protein
MSDFCEMPLKNATPEEIREILKSARLIVVVGLPEMPDRDVERAMCRSARDTYCFLCGRA